MQKTSYQTPELRDENDVIIQQGAFGKNTALANATNDGWIDYVMNNLEALHETVGDGAASLDGNGHVVEPANLAIGDEDGNRIKNSYLKLTGGSLSGTLNIAQNLRMQDNQENIYGGMYVPASSATEQYLQLYGGESTGVAGAKLMLRPPGDGRFELTARSSDGSNTYTLTNNNSGALLWRGGELAPKASPAFTGTPTVPTPANGDNSAKIANTAFVKNNYLSLSGGTMTGALTTASQASLRRSVNNDHAVIMGGTEYTNSATLVLRGGDETNYNGEFQINARSDVSTATTLVGKPNGELIWGGYPIPIIGNNAGGHNSIYRGKNIGTSVTADQYAEISAGTFRDMYIGDYWTASGKIWRIAAFDYWYNIGDNGYLSTHHVVIVPDDYIINSVLSAADTTAGGYVGTDFYSGNNDNTAKTSVTNAINSIFGSSHILTHREMLTNAVTNGQASSWAWYDSTFEVMSEAMVFGHCVWGTADHETAIDKTILPLFALEPSRITNRQYYWLRSVSSSTTFSYVANTGLVTATTPSHSIGIRPAFAIKA